MGVILYEMITGMLPFGVAETDPIDIYNAVLANQPNLDLIQEKKEKDLILRLL